MGRVTERGERVGRVYRGERVENGGNGDGGLGLGAEWGLRCESEDERVESGVCEWKQI